MIRGDGAPALRDDRRMRHARFVAHVLRVIDDVVRIFLERVVDTRFEVRLRTVVVDAKAAAHVEKLEPCRAVAPQFRIEPRRFGDRAFHLADIRDLAAQMEVQQLETIRHSEQLQLFERLHHFRGAETELRAIPAGRFPAPRTAACQLRANPDRRAHTDTLRVLGDQRQLGILLDHRDDLAPDLLGQHRHLDVLVVFEAVTDDGSVVIGQRHHSQQFRLRTRFEAEFIGLAELQHLFHNLALLIHLDGVNTAVPAVIFVLPDRHIEGVVQFAQAVLQNLCKAHQNRKVDAPQNQRIDQLLQIDRAVRLFLGVHEQLPAVADRKISLAPARNVVQLACILRGPSVGGLQNE